MPREEKISACTIRPEHRRPGGSRDGSARLEGLQGGTPETRGWVELRRSSPEQVRGHRAICSTLSGAPGPIPLRIIEDLSCGFLLCYQGFRECDRGAVDQFEGETRFRDRGSVIRRSSGQACLDPGRISLVSSGAGKWWRDRLARLKRVVERHYNGCVTRPVGGLEGRDGLRAALGCPRLCPVAARSPRGRPPFPEGR
jgi:hypothetical protein